jgi:hypothetical protein
MDCANRWDKTWTLIKDHVEQTLHEEMEETYKKLNKKIDKLIERREVITKQQQKQQQCNFYRRAKNLTNIMLTKEEQ